MKSKSKSCPKPYAFPPPPQSCWLLNIKWLTCFEHVIQSFFNPFLLVSVLGSTPNHLPLKYRCAYSCYVGIRYVYNTTHYNPFPFPKVFPPFRHILFLNIGVLPKSTRITYLTQGQWLDGSFPILPIRPKAPFNIEIHLLRFLVISTWSQW